MANLIVNLLNKITGRGVITFGTVGAMASSWLLGLHSFEAVASLMAFVALLIYSTKVQALFSKWLNGFADVPAWPRFVALGIASVIAAHHGGRQAVLVMAFLLTAMDGNVFDALY